MNYRTALAVLGAAILIPTFGVAAQLGSNISTPVVSNAATSTPDVYQVQYFRQANTSGVSDTIIDIVDPGTNGLAPLCADIYVLLPDEELSECCGCPITHNQLIEGGVNANLTGNPATPQTTHNGVIKIISAVQPSNGCAASVVNPTPTPTLRSWKTAGNGQVEEFASAGLSAAEQAFLATTCGDFVSELSGHGICSCPVAPGSVAF
jgi:hypothetical protein